MGSTPRPSWFRTTWCERRSAPRAAHDGPPADSPRRIDDDVECVCDFACTVDRCPDFDLGSAVGPGVAEGTTSGLCSQREAEMAPGCSYADTGQGPEVTFRWTAPAAGTFTFDTEGSESTLDTVLYLISDCSGSQLACDDDGGSGRLSQLSQTLAAGDTVILVLDGWGEGDLGRYRLNISGP